MKPPLSGFTLIELLVVLVLLALASTLVVVNMRSPLLTSLDNEAQRLQQVLENARAQARSRQVSLLWRSDDQGFVISPIDSSVEFMRMPWMLQGTLSDPDRLLISAEPVQAPSQLTLRHAQVPNDRWVIETDGVHGFHWKP
jgi:general secretion pathway protein H